MSTLIFKGNTIITLFIKVESVFYFLRFFKWWCRFQLELEMGKLKLIIEIQGIKWKLLIMIETCEESGSTPNCKCKHVFTFAIWVPFRRLHYLTLPTPLEMGIRWFQKNIFLFIHSDVQFSFAMIHNFLHVFQACKFIEACEFNSQYHCHFCINRTFNRIKSFKLFNYKSNRKWQTNILIFHLSYPFIPRILYITLSIIV